MVALVTVMTAEFFTEFHPYSALPLIKKRRREGREAGGGTEKERKSGPTNDTPRPRGHQGRAGSKGRGPTEGGGRRGGREGSSDGDGGGGPDASRGAEGVGRATDES